MKIKTLFFLLVSSFLIACTNSASQNQNTRLSAAEFSEKIKQFGDASIVDVRTPEEYEKGHIIHAKNIDWNSDAFENEIVALDKNKAVLVYCLSGGRSSSAAAMMRNSGFKEVYELDGGIMKWRASNLPESTGKTSEGMNIEQFNTLLKSEKIVLVDFFADWCVPCKKMKPFLDEIAQEKSSQIILVRVNADDNQALCKALKIDGLPVLQLYKNNQILWSNVGFIDKESILKAIDTKK